MTISWSAACSEPLRRASSASSHRHSAIFCRSNPPRPIDTWSSSAQTPPRLTWILGWHVDSGAIGQRHHGPTPGVVDQTPAYLVIPDDRQQTAMQDAELLAKRPSNNEQRFDQR